MKTVAIISPTGMLGSATYQYLQDKYKLVLIYRNKAKLRLLNKVYGGVKNHRRVLFDLDDLAKDGDAEKFVKAVGEIEAIINCAGVIKPYCRQNPKATFFINANLPHILSYLYRDKLIHLSTDCVFNGVSGAPYREKSPKTPTDLYGLTKSLGEPFEHSLVFRTSVIGPEIDGGVNLLEWFKKQGGRVVRGFTNHLWNGITSRQFALICGQIIGSRRHFPSSGLFHIFSTTLTKYGMLKKLKEKYKVNVTIKPSGATHIDRRLATDFDFCQKLEIPSFDKMLEEL